MGASKYPASDGASLSANNIFTGQNSFAQNITIPTIQTVANQAASVQTVNNASSTATVIKILTSNYTPTLPIKNNTLFYFDDSIAGSANFNLPAATNSVSFFVKSGISSIVTIVPNGTDTIDFSITLSNSNTVGLSADSVSKWKVFYNSSFSGDMTFSQATGVAALNTNVVTNAKLAQAPAATFLANNTGGTANVNYITALQARSMLGFSGLLVNGIIYYTGSTFTTSGNFTWNDGTSTLSTLNANFSAGASGFKITGTNAAANIGTNLVLAQSSVSGGFFSNSVSGDVCIRQGDVGFKLLAGVGSGISQLVMTNALVTFNTGIQLPTPGGTASTLDTYEVTTHVTNMTGALSITGYTIVVKKIGGEIFLTFPDISGTAIASANITAVTVLPARFRPAATERHVLQGVRITANPIVVEITATGGITIYGNTTLQTFLNGNAVGLSRKTFPIAN